MTIYVIYHHSQRQRAIDWLTPLLDQGWNFNFAPLGLEVGSDAWKDAVRKSVSNAEAALVLVTKESANDEMVAWRAELVQEQHKPLLPVLLDREISYPQHGTLSRLQFLLGDERGQEFLMAELSRIVPRKASCFVSYSREDASVASKLSLDLRAESINVWRDEDDIPSGASWDKEVESALTKATHILFLVSPKSVASRTVTDEISFAIEHNKIVIPCIIASAEIPMRVRRHQWIDFEKGYDLALSKLLRELREWSSNAA
jgi:hypothetical protein